MEKYKGYEEGIMKTIGLYINNATWYNIHLCGKLRIIYKILDHTSSSKKIIVFDQFDDFNNPIGEKWKF